MFYSCLLQKHASQASSTHGKQSISHSKQSTLPNITGTSVDDKVLETNLLASCGSSRAAIDNLKAQAASISTYYDRLSSENDSMLAPYRRDFIKCNETLSNLQQSYQYMQLQLKNIENEMNMVQSQSKAIQEDISKIKLQQEARMRDLTSSHAEVVHAIEKDREMKTILDKVHLLENQLDMVTNVIWDISVPSSPSSTSLSSSEKNQAVFSTEIEELFEIYLATELKCTEFLSKRSALMLEKSAQLEREIVEYSNLGMKVSYQMD